jgi:multiple sugar transport system permease protein
MRRRGRRGRLGLTSAGLIALVLALPFLYMVSTSLMGESDTLAWPPRLVPERPHFENYVAVLNALPFGRFLLNSTLFAAGVTLGQLLTSALAGYAFARMRFPGRDRLFLSFLAVLMVPAVVLVIPRFLMIDAIGWVDSYAGLISTELVSVWGIFLLRQAFLTLPRDLEDAARLDGAGEWTVFWRVMLPLTKPALATLGVVAFVDQWKSFLWPLVATRSAEMQVVEVGLARFHEMYSTNGPYQMAAAVIVTLPLLLIFVVAQRYFIRGLEVAGSR